MPPNSPLKFDRITPTDVNRVLCDERFRPSRPQDIMAWRWAIEKALSLLEGVRFEYPLNTSYPNIHRDACRPFDRDFGKKIPWLREPVVVELRKSLIRWLNLCLKPTLHPRFDDLVALGKEKNGKLIEPDDIRSRIGISIIAAMQETAKRFGPTHQEQELAWALMSEHVARVAQVERVRFQMPLQIKPFLRRSARGPIHSETNPRLGRMIHALSDFDAAAEQNVVIRVSAANLFLIRDHSLVPERQFKSLHSNRLIEARIEMRGGVLHLVSQENTRAIPIRPESDFQVRQWQIFIDNHTPEE